MVTFFNIAHCSFQKIAQDGQSPSKKSVNFIVVDDEAKIKTNYGNEVKELFKAQAYKYNFVSKHQQAYINVNSKVYKNTNKQIKKFLPEGESKFFFVNFNYLLSKR